MGSHIQPSRFLDSTIFKNEKNIENFVYLSYICAVLSLFAMLVSATFLYMFSEFYMVSIELKLFNNKLAFILTRLFPFKKSFDYNLTHILLLTLCIILLSLKPDYDLKKSGGNIKKEKQRNNEKKKGCIDSTCGTSTPSLSQESEDVDEKNKSKGRQKGKAQNKK